MFSQVRILSLLLLPSPLRKSSSTETENTVRQTSQFVAGVYLGHASSMAYRA